MKRTRLLCAIFLFFAICPIGSAQAEEDWVYSKDKSFSIQLVYPRTDEIILQGAGLRFRIKRDKKTDGTEIYACITKQGVKEQELGEAKKKVFENTQIFEDHQNLNAYLDTQYVIPGKYTLWVQYRDDETGEVLSLHRDFEVQERTLDVGFETAGKNQYYMTAQGMAKNVRLNIAGSWYGFDKAGTMQRDWSQLGEDWYLFNEYGVQINYWREYAGDTYYLGDDGKMRTGWQEIDGKTYYFNESGVMQTGTVEIEGKTYQFNENGQLTGS